MSDGKIVGILSDSPDTIRAMVRQNGSPWIDLRFDKVTSLPNLKEPYVDITMPCGERCILKLDELPKKSLKCTCGDPTHYFIEYIQPGRPHPVYISSKPSIN